MGILRRSSFRPPYHFSATGPLPNWDFGGATVVSSDQIRVTPDRQSRRGWIWNKVPSHMRAWEAELEFNINGQGRNTFGDGLALWYTKDSMEQGTHSPISGRDRTRVLLTPR